MIIQDGYRIALTRCGCERCTKELERLNKELPRGEATITRPATDIVMAIEVEGWKKKKSRPLITTHYGTGRTIPRRRTGYERER